MIKICELSKKKCITCNGGMSLFKKKEINKILKNLLSKWLANKLEYLYKFVDIMNFTNKITKIAKQKDHHDLIISYWQHIFEICIHKINNLIENDFILEKKIYGISYEQ